MPKKRTKEKKKRPVTVRQLLWLTTIFRAHQNLQLSVITELCELNVVLCTHRWQCLGPGELHLPSAVFLSLTGSPWVPTASLGGTTPAGAARVAWSRHWKEERGKSWTSGPHRHEVQSSVSAGLRHCFNRGRAAARQDGAFDSPTALWS